MTNVGTGRHDCYDRVAVDVPGAKEGSIGYSVRYVSQLVQAGSGQAVPVPGRAVLEIVIRAPACDLGTGKATYPAKPGHSLPGVRLAGYRSSRVQVVDGHLVVDVEHRWRLGEVSPQR